MKEPIVGFLVMLFSPVILVAMAFWFLIYIAREIGHTVLTGEDPTETDIWPRYKK